MSEYKAPNNDYFHHRAKNGGGNKTKKVTYIQEHMNKVKNNPSSAAYHKTEDWDKHHPARAGKFQWKERKTIAGDIFKKKPSPGPSNYKADTAQYLAAMKGKIPGNYITKDSRITHF